MRFHADVQIHSKYSRATAKNADIDHLALWGRKKGVTVVGTGDFTHPAWLEEIREKLVPAEPGLFRLRPDLEQEMDRRSPAACTDQPVRFMLEVEISTIYKRGDKVRKIHHLIFVPDLHAADKLVSKLARIGNLASDGRPILGLDSRDLLEIVLETGPESYLIPAHIWTPWFAVLGSKSGFDSVDACYADLADHIFAVETGLSSDPAMNWRIKALDRFRLVSNSDAHSPPKIGREATTYNTDLDYFKILHALKTGEGFEGTLEFFPEEGKYHMDGHRKCGVSLTPEETKAYGGLCPECGGKITVGVLHRIDSLADRTPGEALAAPPPNAAEVVSLVPLPEILAELHDCGVSTKRVMDDYENLLAKLGPELSILESAPVEDIARVHSPLLAEAVSRLRAGQVIRQSGYDGEYGTIRLFEDDERRERTSGVLLFNLPHKEAQARPVRRIEAPKVLMTGHAPAAEISARPAPTSATGMLAGLDDNQRAAAEMVEGPLLIKAGPGSGKTRTLTHRIAYLIDEHGAAPDECLAITFTRRAAAELGERLVKLLGERGKAVRIHTFHSFGLWVLREHPEAAGLKPGFHVFDEATRLKILVDDFDMTERNARSTLNALSTLKRSGKAGDRELTRQCGVYDSHLRSLNAVDFDDLVGLTLSLFKSDENLLAFYRERCRFISVDEVQDVDPQQFDLIKMLAPGEANLCVIGDPDQAIYGFRGAQSGCFEVFAEHYPNARHVTLDRNYRSSGTIVQASAQMLHRNPEASAAAIVREMAARITVHTARSAEAEAEFVVSSIEQMIGGHSFFSIDSGRAGVGPERSLGFSDFAVLYRTDAQADVLSEAFARSGLPFQRHGHRRLTEIPAVERLLAAMADTAPRAPLVDRIRAAARQMKDAPGEDELDASDLQSAQVKLLGFAQAYANDAVRFEDAISLATEADLWDPRADRISLLTLHASKGLEFPVVFIVGLEDEVLPLHGWGAPDDEKMAEERRLFYVGMTRAEDCLILSHAKQRHWHGKARDMAPSPFLGTIQSVLLERTESAVRLRKPKASQIEMF